MRHDDAAALGIPRAACHNAVDVSIGILANALSPGTQPPSESASASHVGFQGLRLQTWPKRRHPFA